jgi:hypothetical protein
VFYRSSQAENEDAHSTLELGAESAPVTGEFARGRAWVRENETCGLAPGQGRETVAQRWSGPRAGSGDTRPGSGSLVRYVWQRRVIDGKLNHVNRRFFDFEEKFGP